MSLKYPDDDTELKEAVRGDTLYDDTPDELSSDDLDRIVERAKGRLELETGVSESTIFSDDGLSFALVAYACMRAKAAIENISLSSYRIGQEDVEFHNADPDDSQQLQQWADDVRVGLDASDRDSPTGPTPQNTGDFIGEKYYDTH